MASPGTSGICDVWAQHEPAILGRAIHIHGLQFQVMERSHGPEDARVVADYVDPGWEDTVLPMPNERVKLLVRFADFAGACAYQCHMHGACSNRSDAPLSGRDVARTCKSWRCISEPIARWSFRSTASFSERGESFAAHFNARRFE